MLKIIIGIFLSFLILFIYCACVISGRCSREEEERERKRKEGIFEKH